MKKISFLPVLIVTLIFSALISCPVTEEKKDTEKETGGLLNILWNIDKIDTSVQVRNVSSAIDSNNKLHLSYYDYDNKDLKYATNATGSWVFSTIDYDGDVGECNKIAVDSNNKVHISYYDYTNKKLKYATNAGGDWAFSDIDSSNYYSLNDIAVDSNNKVHISYSYYTSRDLKYATNKSGDWVLTTIDPDGNVGDSSSIAVDKNNYIHISYYDSTNSNLKYATNKSGDWVLSEIDTEGDVGYSSRIVIDKNNYLHISYIAWDDLNYKTLKYATNNSGSWVKKVIDYTSSDGDTSIVCDKNNKIHIANLSNASTWAQTKYINNVNGGWSYSFIESMQWKGYSFTGDMAINSNNKIYICYGWVYPDFNLRIVTK